MGSKKYYTKRYSKSADSLKFFLMPFVFVAAFGFPGAFGGYISTLCVFAAPAFFILCGFFVLIDDPDKRLAKLKRGAKSAGRTFLLLFVSYLAINVIYYLAVGAELFPSILSKRMWFHFFVLSVWPFQMGSTIWFIQCLFYAYVILIVMEKWQLFKRYKIILLLTAALSLVVGEFAGVVELNIFGYPFFPVNVVTCALPFLLLGAWMREKSEMLFHISTVVYILLFFGGLALSFAEMEILMRTGKLIYTGQSVGGAVTAFAVCGWALTRIDTGRNFVSRHGRNYAKRMYALSQPVAFAILILAGLWFPEEFAYVRSIGGIVAYFLCLGLAFLIGIVKMLLLRRKAKNKRKKAEQGGAT